ncbi:hypothetical protein HMPREF9193_01692 [Treponema lecithinolyticum ATCC 700332]|uniref:Uncharacterized protein n=1 Tax=Treponema lecithinolyticum ATCC 700332 TaxID=1321815 RepID=A0ABN0NX86_TRELE|nr:hypothetical protein HMPREF9193_01692 [Treponema lecithinolyticum ATCC 700332]
MQLKNIVINFIDITDFAVLQQIFTAVDRRFGTCYNKAVSV